MRHRKLMTPGLIYEIVLIDLLALFLAVGTVSVLWHISKRTSPNEVKELGSFLTFIFVVVPFVILVYFGMALINYDAMAMRSDWPPVLPLKGPLSAPLISAVIFYIGQTLWLWRDWRKLR